MPIVRVGVTILPESRWPAAGRLWQEAETLGFDHAWTYDHLGWRTLVDEPWFDGVYAGDVKVYEQVATEVLPHPALAPRDPM